MIVLTLTDCPPSLRGELTRWLLEINTGVYVGRVSARVRDRIWQRVQEQAKKGRATLVFSSGNSEQRLDFRTHNADWEPIDFDGLKLMLRPSSERLSSRTNQYEKKLNAGFSKAAKIQHAKRMSKKKSTPLAWSEFVVIDIETTGLSPDRDEIIEIGAVKVINNEVADQYHSMVKIKGKLPSITSDLTGINDEILRKDGRPLNEVLPEFLEFAKDMPVIAHNSDFDYSFLRAACAKHNLPLFSNRRLDTLTLARRYIDNVRNYKLETLLEHFNIPYSKLHRSLGDCFATMQLFQKLNEFIRNQ